MNDWDAAARALDEALGLAEPERSDRVASYPPALRHEVEELLAAHARAGAFLSDNPADPGRQLSPGDRLGPWRVDASIGRGGMGAVYRVVRADGQFEMTAAAKVVAAGHATAEAAQRFREERQILALLDHPNIARLVDGGVDTDGRPYLVMELVDGVAVTAYARGRPLADRLELFRTVCAAVHCAHQRLVVHRDIKPGNVLVTIDGTVKLVDFGIASPLLASVVSSWQPLTPAYASPEQLRGDPVTTAADVWSLGALLYELVAGHPPFDLRDAWREQAVAVVTMGPPPPGEDADLNAIVARAMHLDPAARYASPAEMAADVSRFLRGYPIEARARTTRYVTERYLRRHRGGAVLTAVALLAVVAAAAAAIWQAQVARRARDVAERRYDDVRQLAGAMIFGAHDRIAPLPGSSDARRFLVEQGLAYLDRLSRETHGDVAAERELAAGYMRLGDVQGRPSDFNLGDASGALGSYAKAEAVARRLIDRGPGRPPAEDVRRLAIIHGRISDVYLFERRPEAIDRARAAVDTLVSASLNDTDVETQLALGYAHFMLASATQTLRGTLPADDWDAALAIYERLLTRDPASDALLRNVALIHKNIGTFYNGEGGDSSKVIEHLDKAMAIDRARVAAAPRSPTARLDLSFDLSESGTVLVNRGEFEAAAGHYRQAVELRQALADEDPHDVRARGRLVFAQVRLGRALSHLPQPADARKQFEDAIRNAEQVLTVSPDAVNTIADRAIARAGLGAISRNCSLLQQAAADMTALGARAPVWLGPLIDGFRRQGAC